jgi:AcrR family transcriptional regulator
MVLLAKGGRDALTTRAVADVAGVQPPILYRLFGDKTGLLNAVADYGFGIYMDKKRPSTTPRDPVESLQAGWKLHVEFGLTHPELYLLMYANPHPGKRSGAAERSHQALRDHMQRVAAAGRLRISEERAARLFHAAACGTVMTLLDMNVEDRDPSLPEAACMMALATIVAERHVVPAPSIVTTSTTLRALLTGVERALPSGQPLFTEAEQGLLVEWLDRLKQNTSL